MYICVFFPKIKREGYRRFFDRVFTSNRITMQYAIACMHALLHTCIYDDMYACMLAYMHACTCIYANIYTSMQVFMHIC